MCWPLLLVAVVGFSAITAELSSRIREVATRLASPSPTEEPRVETASVVSIPVLSPGTDPAGLEAAGAAGVVIERLLLDRRLFPASAQGLFAYEVAERDMKHLRGVARPGDHVVLQRSGRPTAPDRICAVRQPSAKMRTECTPRKRIRPRMRTVMSAAPSWRRAHSRRCKASRPGECGARCGSRGRLT